MTRIAPVLALTLGLLVLAGGGCKRGTEDAAKNISLNGAGATFPYPLYSKWVAEYQRQDPRVHINYQSIGSGGGIRQITERTVDFGATDAPMTEAELAKTPGPIVHIPTALGAVVIAYHLPAPADQAKDSLKLSAEAVAGIFLGDIKTWNHPTITALNPGLVLPDQPITLVYRSDGSGTTAVFTQYLAAVSPRWKEQVGTGKSVRFPLGLGAKGNEGVAGQIKASPGALGYVELAYAKQIGLAMASLRNRAGQFVAPTLAGITAAASRELPDDLRTSIVDAPAPEAYPISAFTYLLVYVNQEDPVKGKALAQFIDWALRDGQRLGPALDYAPLPAAVVAKARAKLGQLRTQNQPVIPEL